MSADNWAVCPRCKEKEMTYKEGLFHASRKAYGNVSEEEFLQQRREAMAHAVDDCQTFREDYDIGIDEDGEISIGYKGGCAECGFKRAFHYDGPGESVTKTA